MKKLKILAILPHSIGGRLTLSSIADGFIFNDFEVVFFDELKENPDKLKILYDRFLPDFLLGYDFCAISAKNNNNFAIKTINYFSDVIQDSHSGKDWQKYYFSLNEDENFTFYWDKKLCEEKKNEIKNIFYLPHFVNCEIYKNLKLEKQCDIMFAGRLDTDYRLNFLLNLKKALPELKFRWHAIKKHYDDAIMRCQNEKDKKIIENIYGGFIDTERKMSIAINEAKIVINMNEQGSGSLNYRTFQTMACETLLLSDNRDEVNLLFKTDFDFVIYENFDELVNKINFYLKNKNKYDFIVKNARNSIKKRHNSKENVKKMLEIIQKVEKNVQ